MYDCPIIFIFIKTRVTRTLRLDLLMQEHAKPQVIKENKKTNLKNYFSRVNKYLADFIS